MLPSELRLASGSVGPSALHSVRQCFKMVCAPVYRVACVLISLHTSIETKRAADLLRRRL